jgi:hypothetical protein
MAKHHGGVGEDSDDRGKAAYKALLALGNSGFNALLGGGQALHRQGGGEKQRAFSIRRVKQ